MSDILDLIDNAISDHYTSADAMRWTPEAPVEATPPAPSLRVVYDLTLLGVTSDEFCELIRASALSGISLFRSGT